METPELRLEKVDVDLVTKYQQLFGARNRTNAVHAKPELEVMLGKPQVTLEQIRKVLMTDFILAATAEERLLVLDQFRQAASSHGASEMAVRIIMQVAAESTLQKDNKTNGTKQMAPLPPVIDKIALAAHAFALTASDDGRAASPLLD